MSFAAMSWAMSEQARGVRGGSAQAILHHMAWLAIDEDEVPICRATVEQIAHLAGVSRTTAYQTIRALAGPNGALELVAGGSGGRPAEYRIRIDSAPVCDLQNARRSRSQCKLLAPASASNLDQPVQVTCTSDGDSQCKSLGLASASYLHQPYKDQDSKTQDSPLTPLGEGGTESPSASDGQPERQTKPPGHPDWLITLAPQTIGVSLRSASYETICDLLTHDWMIGEFRKRLAEAVEEGAITRRRPRYTDIVAIAREISCLGPVKPLDPWSAAYVETWWDRDWLTDEERDFRRRAYRVSPEDLKFLCRNDDQRRKFEAEGNADRTEHFQGWYEHERQKLVALLADRKGIDR